MALGAHLRTRVGVAQGCLRLDRAREAQILYEASVQCQRVGLGDGSLGGHGIVGGAGGMLARILEPLAQAAERRAQVMGDVVGDLAHALHVMLDALQHGVEAQHELVDLVVGAAHGDAR